MEQESSLICKKLKFMTSLQQDNPSPLGLMLRKTPSFLSLLETKLSYERFSCTEPRKKERYSVIAEGINKKIKASNFSATILRIGSWERVSRYEGQLVAKCYYAKKKLVWEFLDQGLKNKVEFLWSDIASLKATFDVNKPDTLEIELLTQPYFFKETNPQPRKHTLWKTTDDFTDGQASIYRRHFLQFPQGGLQKHYEKLLRSDNRLSLLSKKSFPSSASPFFSSIVIQQLQTTPYLSFSFGGKNLNDIKLPLEKEANSDYAELLQDSVSRTSSVLQHPVLRFLRTSSGSVINLPPVKEKLEGDFNQQYWSKAPFVPARLTRTSNLTAMAPVPRMIPSEVSLTLDNSMFGIPFTEGGEIDYDPGKINHSVDFDCSGICSKSFCQILEAPASQERASQTFMLPVSNQSEMDRTNFMGFHIPNRNKIFEQLG